MSETSSILILALVTIVLSVYSLVVTKWWRRNRDRLIKCWGGPRWSGLLSLVLLLVFIAAVIVAPGFLLTYLMNDMKLVKNIGTYGRSAALLTWIGPSAIYSLIYAFRGNRPKK
jgi:formate hydrogenlyase subunit 3/multisubunit Na+/H+ antiporter MnhD subunit